MVETSTKAEESQPELLSSPDALHSDVRNTSSDSGKGSDSALSSPEASPTYIPPLHHRVRHSPEPSPPYHAPVFTRVGTSPNASPTFHPAMHPQVIPMEGSPAFRQVSPREGGSPPTFHPMFHPRMRLCEDQPPPHPTVSPAPAASPATSTPGQSSPEPRHIHPVMPSHSPPTVYHTPRPASPAQTFHYRPELPPRSSPSTSPPSHPKVSPVSSPETVITYYPPVITDRDTMSATPTPYGLQTSGGHVLYRPTSLASSESLSRLSLDHPPLVRLAGSVDSIPRAPSEEHINVTDSPTPLPSAEYSIPRVLSRPVDIPPSHRHLTSSPGDKTNETERTSAIDKPDSDKNAHSPTDSCYGSSPESTESTAPVVIPSSVPSGTPVAPPPQVPGKRRPGRPRGSTRKYKHSFIECRKREGSEADQFSLRSFFEAGGRDYNEYLEWLKRRSPQQPPPSGPMIPKPVAPTSFTSSLVAVGSTPGVPHPPHPPPPADHSAPIGSPMPHMRMPHHTIYPTPPGLSPAMPPQGYRPMFIPRPTNAPSETTPPKLVPVTQIQSYPVMPHPSGCPMPPMPFPPHNTPTRCHGSMPIEPNALDLSAKKRKSDSHLDENTIVETHKFLKNAPLSEPEATRCLTPPLSPSSDSPPSKPPQLIPATLEDSPVERDRRLESGNLSSRVTLSSWDVESVVRFVSSVPGCQEYAEVFREHRIDGATLPHLSEGHLINFVKMKLGPAIRLRLAIQRL